MDTVSKYDYFPATQNLREINFCESGVSKSAIFTVSEPLKLGFSEFLQFFRTVKLPKNEKSESLYLLKF